MPFFTQHQPILTSMQRHTKQYPAKSASGGFTLIEIMVVVVIIGILISIVGPRVFVQQEKALAIKAKTDIRSIENGLNLYRLDNYSYPSTEQGLEALVQKPQGQPEATNWKAGYIERLPKDPWGAPYQYLNPGVHAEVDIYTLGRDRRPGGEGPDADIGNWNLND